MENLLSSWKEIAAYLGKGVRTVQRWERHLGLPVQRPSKDSKGIVFATTTDLDAWIHATRARASFNEQPDELRSRIEKLEQENAALREALDKLVAETRSDTRNLRLGSPIHQRASETGSSKAS